MSKAEDMSTQAKPTAPLRTKSYFAPSIQAAIAIARTELGEDLLLVSSQSTVGQDRQFGDFQVVFASGDEALSPPDEESALQDSLRPAPQSFQDVLSAMLPAATAPAGTKEEKLTHIHLCLADLSISLSDSERGDGPNKRVLARLFRTVRYADRRRHSSSIEHENCREF